MKYWTTREGTKLKISEMETDHIKNCMKMLERNLDKYNANVSRTVHGFDDLSMFIDLDEVSEYVAFQEELEKR